MTKKNVLQWLMIALPMLATAQQPDGVKVINNLCGCFDVDFKYAETFAPDGKYQFHPKEEIPPVAELALPIEQTDKKIVIQHLLVVSDSMIVKHWREEWTYENPVIWEYQAGRSWKKKLLSADAVKGKWTQTVWETSDEPRYQGISPFVYLDNKIVWQSTTDAPLPRREYSTRSDYNLLRRTNRINITDTGYLHEQDNQKIISDAGNEKLLVLEKGYNTYKRLNNNECKAALKYWEKNKAYWQQVRKVWESYLSNTNELKLAFKVEGKMMHEYLFALAKQYSGKPVNNGEAEAQIKATIQRFVIGAQNNTAAK